MAESSKNGEKNNVGNGKTVHNEQFLHFPLCFQQDLYCRNVKPGLAWERVKSIT